MRDLTLCLASMVVKGLALNTGCWVSGMHHILSSVMKSFSLLASLLFAGLQVQNVLASNHFYGITISSFDSGGGCRSLGMLDVLLLPSFKYLRP